jgi:hypothetical protein
VALVVAGLADGDEIAERFIAEALRVSNVVDVIHGATTELAAAESAPPCDLALVPPLV